MSVDSENNLDFTDRRWSFIDKKDINENEFINELDNIFVGAFMRLITIKY